MSKIEVDTIEPQSGTTVTLGASGDTITVPSGATLSVDTAATISGAITNTPMFIAGMTEMSLPYNTFTKITYSSEIVDTDNAYDHSTNYRFTVPSGEGGFYYLSAWYTVSTGTDSSGFELWTYKNGSSLNGGDDMKAKTVNQSYNTVFCSTVVELSAGDYIEMYAKQADGSATGSYNIGYANEGRFLGYKLLR